MNHLGLFEGIGGFSLAARWAGWETLAWCEWNEFGQRVLKHHFPKAIGHGDITQTDFSIYRGRIDIITGGFPCQPYSQAGKRLGKEDERHLWPEMLRAIKEVQPRWVVGENVLGLVNWSGGLVFHEVQVDLEAAGYEVFPYVLPACAVNAPHRRDRIWFVAHSNGSNESNANPGSDTDKAGEIRGRQKSNVSDSLCSDGKVTNSRGRGQQGSGRAKGQSYSAKNRDWKASWAYNDGRWPSEQPICGGDDGIPSGLDGISFSKWYEEAMKSLGNAIVPQVAFQIFQAINQYEEQLP